MLIAKLTFKIKQLLYPVCDSKINADLSVHTVDWGSYSVEENK